MSKSLTHPDNQKLFSQKQDRWQEFSDETVRLATESLEKQPDIHFQELYVALAKRRAQIARELGHGTDSEEEGDITQYYGQFRSMAGENAVEYFVNDGDDNQVWASQVPAIFREVEFLKSSTNPNVQRKILAGDGGVQRPHILVLNPHREKYRSRYYPEFDGGCSKILSVIEIYEENPPIIAIHYAHISNKADIAGNWALLNDLFQDAKKSETEEKFIENTGKLMCFLGKMFPVKRGSAAIGEWMLNALAAHKGYEVEFDFDKAGGIGWDFKALVTPDPDKYAQWFKEAFTFTKTPSKDPEPHFAEEKLKRTEKDLQ